MSVYIILGLLLLTCQIFARPQNVEKKIKILHDFCVNETRVDEKFIDMSNKGTFMKDPALKCYMKCMFVQLQIMNDGGEVNMDLVLSEFQEIPDEYLSTLGPILPGCGKIKGVDECDTAFLINKCFYSLYPKFYWLP